MKLKAEGGPAHGDADYVWELEEWHLNTGNPDAGLAEAGDDRVGEEPEHDHSGARRRGEGGDGQ